MLHFILKPRFIPLLTHPYLPLSLNSRTAPSSSLLSFFLRYSSIHSSLSMLYVHTRLFMPYLFLLFGTFFLLYIQPLHNFSFFFTLSCCSLPTLLAVPEHKLVPPPRTSMKESVESLIHHFKVRSKLSSLLVSLVFHARDGDEPWC
jgi:hypothetical protein